MLEMSQITSNSKLYFSYDCINFSGKIGSEGTSCSTNLRCLTMPVHRSVAVRVIDELTEQVLLKIPFAVHISACVLN